MKKLDWLADFAESQKAKLIKTDRKKIVASKNATAKIQNSDLIIVPKTRLAKAVNGNTVKYKNCKWKVVNASYRDAKGSGVVLQRIGGIDTKKITDPEVRAYNKDVNFGEFDYDVSNASEIPAFTSAAENTAQVIVSERERDLTTPDGRYLLQEVVAEPVPEADAAPMEMEMGTSEQFGEDALNLEEDVVDTETETSNDLVDTDFDIEVSDVSEVDDEVDSGVLEDDEELNNKDISEEAETASDAFDDIDETYEENQEVEEKTEVKKASLRKRFANNRIIKAMLSNKPLC